MKSYLFRKTNPPKWFEFGSKLLILAVLCTAILLPTARPATAYTGIPTFTIIDVVEDTSVTIRTYNFPADETFTVRMGAFGTLAIGGTVVGTTNSGSGGVFEETYTIPASLAGSALIAIRFDGDAGTLQLQLVQQQRRQRPCYDRPLLHRCPHFFHRQCG